MAKRNEASDKKALLETAIHKLEREFGEGVIMRLGEAKRLTTEVIPTGSIYLNIALGVGGFPRGRIVEIYGQESSGKTTVALHTIAEVQKQGGIAAFIDAEHALDTTYAQKIGIDVDSLVVSQPDYGEQALEIADTLISSGVIDVIVIDSVAALIPKAELEGEMGDSMVGAQARLMAQALRKLTGSIAKSKACCIFINQLRQKIGVRNPYESAETTTGGTALKFFASIRLETRKGSSIKVGDQVIGYEIWFKVAKNKVAPPFQKARSFLIFGEGISKEMEIIALAEEYGVIKRSGSWYRYKDKGLAQGQEKLRQLLKDNPELLQAIEAEVLQRLYEEGKLPAPAQEETS